MSDAMLAGSLALALTAALILGRAAEPTPVRELVSRGVLTLAQGVLVADGLSVEEARAIPDECARRCDFNLAREFPLVCDCPGGP